VLVAATLCQDFVWECRGFGAADHHRAPIFYYEPNEDGQPEPAIRYLRAYLESAAKRFGPPLSREQLEAFDALDAAMVRGPLGAR
jgi:hypothetical protein